VLLYNHGDPATDKDMIMFIKKFDDGFYGIMSMKFGQWLYVGNPKLTDGKKFVLAFHTGNPLGDRDMRFNIAPG